MVTKSPRQTTENPAAAPQAEAGDSARFLMGVLTRLQRLLCSLHGHTSLLQFEPGRMYLVCASCGYETPGWEIGRGRRTLRLASERGTMRQTSRPGLAPAQRVA